MASGKKGGGWELSQPKEEESETTHCEFALKIYSLISRVAKACAQLYRYRLDALEQLVTDQLIESENKVSLSKALALFPSASCCSDMEDDGPGQTRAVGMVWRSPQYKEFLHLLDKLSFKQQKAAHGARWAARRLDFQRKPAIQNSSAGQVPRNMPVNCYKASWRDDLKKQSETKSHLLTQKPASPALASLISAIRASLQ